LLSLFDFFASMLIEKNV